MNRIARLASGGEPLGDEPPTEFRIFRKGENPSDQGVFLFDDKAAASVLAAWKRWGVDLIIDLQHTSTVSIEELAMARSDAADARGYFDLEVRQGELWAVNVRWNSDGERRIREKLQRYISPAFHHDDDGRITEVVNVALVSMPATFQPQELIAASRSLLSQGSAVTRARSYMADQKKAKVKNAS